MTYDSSQLGDRPLPPSPYRTLASSATIGRRDDASGWRSLGKYSIGFACFVVMSAMLASLVLFQLTSEGTAKTTLQRSVGALTEIDPLIDRGYDDLQLRAQSANAGDNLFLRDFPIAIALTPAEVRGASKERLHELLLGRSADVLYEQGSSPLRGTAGTGRAGRFSGAGISDRAIGLLRSRNHDILGVLTFALAAAALVLSVMLALVCRGFGRIGSVGAVVLAAAIPLAMAGIGARFYMRIASGEGTEYIQREFLEIGRAVAWIAIRDGLAFLVLGISFVALGLLGSIWTRGRGGTLIRYDR